MQVQGEDKPYDDINITPMLDLAYVLLVIFIIMTTASVAGVKVELPKASATQNLAVPKTRVVSISDQGQVFLDTVPVSLPELEQKLRDAKANVPDLPVILKGDRAVQYDRIMQVLDLCSRVGIASLGLASTRPPGS
jgi:biopolymer transport protein ExbD